MKNRETIKMTKKDGSGNGTKTLDIIYHYIS